MRTRGIRTMGVSLCEHSCVVNVELHIFRMSRGSETYLLYVYKKKRERESPKRHKLFIWMNRLYFMILERLRQETSYCTERVMVCILEFIVSHEKQPLLPLSFHHPAPHPWARGFSHHKGFHSTLFIPPGVKDMKGDARAAQLNVCFSARL